MDLRRWLQVKKEEEKEGRDNIAIPRRSYPKHTHDKKVRQKPEKSK